MDEFPFTQAEWLTVHEAAIAIVNATAIEDHVLTAHARAQLAAVLDALRERHGEHPVLLETAGDFETSDSERARLYRDALTLAGHHSRETESILAALRECSRPVG